MKPIAQAFQTAVGDEKLKLVLVAIADNACDECGLAWPGVRELVSKTELGDRRVRTSLGTLVERGLIEVHRFPHGGRGLATEYVVFPVLFDGVARPCPKCRSNMSRAARESGVHGGRNPARSDRVSGAGPDAGAARENPARTDRVSAETLHARTENPATEGADQPSRTNNPHARAHARTRDRQPEGGQSAAREATSDATPSIPAASRDALADLGLLGEKPR